MPKQKDRFNTIIKRGNSQQKGAADAAAKLIAKYGKAAVSSAVRNFKPAKAVKVTGTKMKTNPKSNVKPVDKNKMYEKI